MTDGAAELERVRELRLRDCLTQLEEIAREMGSDDVELEDALELHAQGKKLLDRANEILATAKLQVAEITGTDGDGRESRQTGGEADHD